MLSIHARSVAEWARGRGSDVVPHAASEPAEAVAASRTAIRRVTQLPAQTQQPSVAEMRTMVSWVPTICDTVLVVTAYVPRFASWTPVSPFTGPSVQLP